MIRAFAQRPGGPPFSINRHNQKGLYMKDLHRLATIACLFLIVAGCLVHMYFGYMHRGRPGHAWGCDDAFISYRYAQNLSEGKGLVYNESERVEGYSNFLYVLLMTPLVMISSDNVYFMSCILNIGFLIGAFLLFRRYVKSYWGENDSYTAGFLFALCPALWLWTVSGMETSLILLLQIALWVFADSLSKEYNKRDFAFFAAAIVLSVLSRADGFVFPLLGIGLLILRRRFKTALMSLLVLGVIIALYFPWRYWYYGYWMPNTYYVKIAGPLGERMKIALQLLREIIVVKGYAVHFVIIIITLLAGLRNKIKKQDSEPHQIESGAIFIIGLIAYWFYIGGDAFTDRFLILTIPVAIFSLFRCIRFFKERLASIGFPIVVLLFQFNPVLHDSNFDYNSPKYDQWVTLGKFLGLHHQGARLAIDASGKVPYFSRLYTIDMLGLNEINIAHMKVSYFQLGHAKYSPDYIMIQDPDLIASWGHPNRDMRFGLLEDLYDKHDYVIRYVVNTTREEKERNIMDIRNASESEFERLYAEGYQYFVLEKIRLFDGN